MLHGKTKAKIQAKLYPNAAQTVFGPVAEALNQYLHPGAVVLDAGCGKGRKGRWSPPLACIETWRIPATRTPRLAAHCITVTRFLMAMGSLQRNKMVNVLGERIRVKVRVKVMSPTTRPFTGLGSPNGAHLQGHSPP